MEIGKADIIGKIRTAIDDIAPSVSDSFTDDTDAELWQATWHAVQALLLKLPLDMLTPSKMTLNTSQPGQQTDPPYNVINASDGSGYIVLDDSKFLRFVSLQLNGWSRPVTELMEPGSEEALSQSSKWSMGTPNKPRAMLDFDNKGMRILRYWTAKKNGSGYDHTVSLIDYIPKAELSNGEEEPPSSETDEEQNSSETVEEQTSSETSEEADQTITCALKDTAEPLVINHAAAIFFEGKKEHDIAEKFRNM